jgi:hypothetical protein
MYILDGVVYCKVGGHRPNRANQALAGNAAFG